MSTPTDPYNSSSKRPFDDEEILEPINDDTVDGDTTEPVFSDEPYEGDVNIDGERIDGDDEFGDDDINTDFERTDASEFAEPAGNFRDEDLNDRGASHEETASYQVERAGDDSTVGSESVANATDDGVAEDAVPVALDADGEPHAYAVPEQETAAATSATTPDYVDEEFLTEDETDSNPTLGGYFRDEDRDEVAGENVRDENVRDERADDEMKIDYASAQEETASDAPTRTSVMSATEPADHLTTDTAAATAVAGTTAAGFMASDETKREHWTTDPGEVEDVPEKPKGRFGAHFLGFLLTLLLVPVAWYLVSDAGARLFLVDNAPWATEQRDNLAILELAGGMIVLVAIALLARSSSFGAQLWGVILMVGGFVGLLVPSLGQQFISWLDGAIGDINPFTGNVVHHLNMDLGTGRIAVFGLVILLLGVVSHYARRAGGVRATALTRRELMLKDTKVEK